VSTSTPPALIPVSVAARLLHLSRPVAYRRARDGSLPLFSGGGRKKVIVAKLSDMIGRAITAEEIEAASH